jgi:hypothetical protein
MGETTRHFVSAILSRRVARQACQVACVVSPVLLLLNHSELLLTQPFSAAVLRKLALNFAVPYLVSSYSAARTAAADAMRSARTGTEAP